MGQVPASQPPRSRTFSPVYGLVGDGRLAHHLSRYFDLKQIPLRRWCRRTGTLESLADDFAPVSHILLALRDDAVEPFVAAAPSFRTSKIWIHFSGALSTPLAEGAHPLTAFGPSLLTLEEYERVAFITERGREDFSSLFPELKNPAYSIPPRDKPLYHALCVMAGNFSVIFFQKLMRELALKWGIPSEAALPLAQGVLKNLLSNPGRALTGPLARGDFATVRANHRSLQGDPYQTVYGAVVEAYLKEVELNEKQGTDGPGLSSI